MDFLQLCGKKIKFQLELIAFGCIYSQGQVQV